MDETHCGVAGAHSLALLRRWRAVHSIKSRHEFILTANLAVLLVVGTFGN